MTPNLTTPVKVHEMTEAQLNNLMKNQVQSVNESPVTTRATFKLEELEQLIRDVKTVYPLKPFAENDHHRLCITFVRDDLNDPVLGFEGCRNFNSIKAQVSSETGRPLTQLVPIVTGCSATVDQITGDYTSFEYFRNPNGNIPYVRPGGEASGLIPPPPPNSNNDDPAVP